MVRPSKRRIHSVATGFGTQWTASARQRRGEFSISRRGCSGRSTYCFGCDACAARGNLSVALFFVTTGSARGDLLVPAVVVPFVRTLPWGERASPVREGAAGVTREVQSELIVIVVRVLLVSTGHGCRLSQGHLSTYKRPPI